MLKQLWQFRVTRIICGVFLIIIGIVVGLLPGPGGFIFWLPGFIILLGEILWLRPVAAYAIKIARKFRFLKRIIKSSRIFIKQKTGWRIWFKKPARSVRGEKND